MQTREIPWKLPEYANKIFRVQGKNLVLSGNLIRQLFSGLKIGYNIE